MKPIVFTGPTLTVAEVTGVIDAECRAPVSQGDVYRAARDGAGMIGIIDGYFDGVPSVWHKEIQWVMGQGIQVFGSASMGALRAAELYDFGMQGVGRIFEDYRSGRLEDDDEVAIIHAPAEMGFKALSVPMVSVRATLDAAVAAGVLPQAVAAGICTHAKALQYADREWRRILDHASGPSTAVPELTRFEAWLADNFVDAKRDDGLAMLAAMQQAAMQQAAMRQASGADRPGPAPATGFEWTDVWNDLVHREGAGEPGEHGRGVLDELRLSGSQFGDFRNRAATRHFAIAQARRQGITADQAVLRDEMDIHRRKHGLLRRKQLIDWLGENDLDEATYEQFLREGWLARIAIDMSARQLDGHILAELKAADAYRALQQRADAKRQVLSGDTGTTDNPAGDGISDLHVLDWYFEQCLGQAVPDDLDAYARAIGLASRAELCRLLRNEREYLSMTGGQDLHDGEDD